jgi:CBS domain-containing protein
MMIKVSEVMTRDVKVVQSTATLRDAARLMQQYNVGALPVYAGHTLAGIVTDRDITVKAVAAGVEPAKGRVEDVMTWKVEWCPQDTDIESAARIMENKLIHRLAVLNREGVLVGIISLSDIAIKTHNQRIVEQVVEATASRTAPSEAEDPWVSFEEAITDQTRS